MNTAFVAEPNPIATRIEQITNETMQEVFRSEQTVTYAIVGTMKHIVEHPIPPKTDNTTLIEGRATASVQDVTENIMLITSDRFAVKSGSLNIWLKMAVRSGT